MQSLIAIDPACESRDICLRRTFPQIEFTMAFQPVVDINRKEVFAYEALCSPILNRITSNSTWG
jgi:hypothetical protein